jgi:hypothetical protein
LLTENYVGRLIYVVTSRGVAWDTWGGGVCRGQYPRVTVSFIFLNDITDPNTIYVYYEDEVNEPIQRITEMLGEMGDTLMDLNIRVKELERRMVFPLTEVDRSHDVAIGARVDTRHSGL